MLVVASASVATAQPKQEETNARIGYNEKDQPAPVTTHRDGDVIELAEPTPAKHGKEFFTIGADAGRFSELRVRAHQGKVIVRRARIELTDGKIITVNVDKVLDRKHPIATIAIPRGPRAIEQVVITTERQTGGTYAIDGVYGGGGSTGVATR